MSDLDENITNILGITELEKKQGKFNDSKKQMQYALIQEQVKEARIECMEYSKELCTLNFDKTGFDLAITFGNRIKELKGDK